MDAPLLSECAVHLSEDFAHIGSGGIFRSNSSSAVSGVARRLSTSEFTVSRERVFLRNAAETLSSPQSIFQLFTFVGRHGVQLSWDTHRRLENELKGMTALFEKAPPRWPQW